MSSNARKLRRMAAAKSRTPTTRTGEASARTTRLSLEGRVTLRAAPAPAEGQPPARPTFVINAYNGGLFRPAEPYWLEYPMVIDLAGAKAAEPIAVLLDHDSTQIIGQSTKVTVSADSVDIEGFVTGDTENESDPARKVVMHAKNGFIWKASLGGDIGRLEKVEAGELVTVNGREFSGPIYVARSVSIDEVSLLSIPADKTTSTKVAAGKKEITAMDFHEWLKAKGFDPTNLEEAQRDTLLKAFQAEQAALQAGGKDRPSSDGDPAAGLQELLAPVKQKRERQASIRAAVKRFAEQRPDQVEAIEAVGRVALAEDWSPERLELQLYRDLNLQVDNHPRPARPEGAIPEQRVIEAALCMAGKYDRLEKHFDERTLEAAHKRWRHGIGLGELLLTAAKVHGFDGLSFRDVGPLLRAAFAPSGVTPFRAAGPSTMDVSGILSNVANKFIVRYFEAADAEWRKIAKRRPVNDFKEITSYSLAADFTYKKIPPGGVFKHGTLGEVAYSNRADTHGRAFAIDRRDIINDDLGAFNQVAFQLGRGGALAFNDVFWAAFLNNLSFFTSGHGNFDDGAETALCLAALEAAETLFLTQAGPDGQPMAVSPRVLLVPTQLKRTALRLMNSTEVRQLADADESSAVGAYGTNNTFAGDFVVASTPYLSSARFTGYSARKWYLLADPNELPVIEACFLNGQERPTVESADADFKTLGIEMRGYFDFGVALQEYRGGVAMKGEV